MAETKTKRIDSARAFGNPRGKAQSNTAAKATNVPVPKGAKTSKKRVGQGPGSGIGKTSARGQKGQKARAASMRRGFEGGQMPLHRRLPKRGFTSRNHTEYQPVNLNILAKSGLSGSITPELLESKKMIKDAKSLIKVLGTGEIQSGIEIVADAFSASAKEKIEKAGGKAILRETKPAKKEA
jgi:large subunit ribosomal protein L15